MTSNSNGHDLFRSGLITQAGKKRRTSNGLPPDIGDYVPLVQPESGKNDFSSSRPSNSLHWQQLGKQLARRLLQLGVYLLKGLMSWRPRELLYIPLALIVLWAVALWWGEEAVFRQKIENCSWNRWEDWPTASTPHRVALVADPQLVDPHTYPGRPWPLSALTVRYTDLYIRKSFQQIQEKLSPDSVFFLGDLFDGGREWSTSSGNHNERESPDKRWRKYNTKYWLKEFGRFSQIFFEPWLRGTSHGGQVRPGRKLVVGLPGNHDLGLGGGIRLPVRKRFQAYFGDGNRLDIVGNHSFVSLDTVSLSAKGQPNVSGRQGLNEEVHNKDVWNPVDQFLHTAKTEKARAIERELRLQNGRPENDLLEHISLELEDPRAHTVPYEDHKGTDIPSIILTHVPLYRTEGTPCGPLRERFPPSKTADGKQPEKDDPNSIHVRHGVQYQNVLTPEISKEIVDLVGNVTHVFSGDDHDYCDIIHRGYTSRNGGIREVTVKSISWAMGVRKPGFVLLSLWNPVDAEGKAAGQQRPDSTIRTHLCLLPDQLSIFIRYAWLLTITLLILLGRAIKTAYSSDAPRRQENGQLLPLTETDSSRLRLEETTSASALSPSKNRIAVRSSAGKPRSFSPSGGYEFGLPSKGAIPTQANEKTEETLNGSLRKQEWNNIELEEPSRRKKSRDLFQIYADFRSSVVQVAIPVLAFYAWLLWNS